VTNVQGELLDLFPERATRAAAVGRERVSAAASALVRVDPQP